MSRTYVESRALNKERQRWYDAFKLLREGETIDEFPFRFDDRYLTARQIEPYTEKHRNDFYLVAWFMCHFGRGSERGPRIAPLCFKDTGDPYLYWDHKVFGFHSESCVRIICLLKYVFGIVNGGVWEGNRRIDQ